jgi:hypothetical protein
MAVTYEGVKARRLRKSEEETYHIEGNESVGGDRLKINK